MLTTRLIPILYLMDGKIVRSERFEEFKIIGDPFHELERYDQWDVDEVVYVDITRSGNGIATELLRDIASRIFSPLAVGGNVRTLDDFARLIRNGADKVLICSAAYHTPELITQAAEKFGSQAVVCGIDVKDDGSVWVDQGRTKVSDDCAGYARALEGRGAGEILLNSIDRDGTAAGYATDIIGRVASAVGVPVVCAGGASGPRDFGVAISLGAIPGAGNHFHFRENAYGAAKRGLRKLGFNVRMDRLAA